MIIAGLAVRAGLLEVVKASLTGSILGKVQLLAPYTMIAVAIYFLP